MLQRLERLLYSLLYHACKIEKICENNNVLHADIWYIPAACKRDADNLRGSCKRLSVTLWIPLHAESANCMQRRSCFAIYCSEKLNQNMIMEATFKFTKPSAILILSKAYPTGNHITFRSIKFSATVPLTSINFTWFVSIDLPWKKHLRAKHASVYQKTLFVHCLLSYGETWAADWKWRLLTVVWKRLAAPSRGTSRRGILGGKPAHDLRRTGPASDGQ